MSLQWVDADGAGRAHPIPDTSGADYPASVSPDGNTLAFLRQSADTSADIYMLSLHGEPKPHPVVNTPAFEGGVEFSPDGRWLAYVSDDSGQMQVYVRPVAGPDRRWPVSTQGGTSPIWSRSGRELFYRYGGKMMVVKVSIGAELTFSPPEPLFEQAFAFGPTQTFANYDVSLDGQRFLMVKNAAGAEHLNVTQLVRGTEAARAGEVDGALTRIPPRRVRNRVSARCGRHGRGVSRPRSEAGSATSPSRFFPTKPRRTRNAEPVSSARPKASLRSIIPTS